MGVKYSYKYRSVKYLQVIGVVVKYNYRLQLNEALQLQHHSGYYRNWSNYIKDVLLLVVIEDCYTGLDVCEY